MADTFFDVLIIGFDVQHVRFAGSRLLPPALLHKPLRHAGLSDVPA
jgi:hypothetical protein